MKPKRISVDIHTLANSLSLAVAPHGKRRLGLLTSIDGTQVVALVLSPESGCAELWDAQVSGNRYSSLSNSLPQAHWYERLALDMFGVVPEGHPRLKHLILHDQYPLDFYPLRIAACDIDEPVIDRKFHFLNVRGEGVYELPVGPIHAGVIEPGHFHFSCFGETILNLEIQLGWVHRGIEKRMTEVPWQKARFVAEAAAGDSAAANALAHAILMESLLGVEIPARAQHLRSMALEIERLAMHIIDVGGLAADIGMVAVAASMSRLRGVALGMGDSLAGSRFLKAFIMPGGVRNVEEKSLIAIAKDVKALRKEVKTVLDMFFSLQAVRDRMANIGKISRSLAVDFGLVGVAARAAGIEYDARNCFVHGAYPQYAMPSSVEKGGDVLARGRVRAKEIISSLEILELLLDTLAEGAVYRAPGDVLPADSVACSVVEGFRGELVHLGFTDKDGKFSRYAIKDPSFNNWTALAIAIRNNLIADFPLCNKSFSLSYSGNDL